MYWVLVGIMCIIALWAPYIFVRSGWWMKRKARIAIQRVNAGEIEIPPYNKLPDGPSGHSRPKRSEEV